MEIKKQGKSLKNINYLFVCEVCGCEFIANREEINIESITCNCPNCGDETNGVEIQKELNEGEENEEDGKTF